MRYKTTGSDPELRKALDKIDELLMGPAGEELWRVLSALRGPDAEAADDELKSNTTAVIRALAFPKWATYTHKYLGRSYHMMSSAMVNRDQPYIELPNREINNHFEGHVKLAALVMGIEMRLTEAREDDDAGQDQ